MGLYRPDTLPFAIMEQELMVTGEVNICLIPATIPNITEVSMVYCLFNQYLLFLSTKKFMVTRE